MLVRSRGIRVLARDGADERQQHNKHGVASVRYVKTRNVLAPHIPYFLLWSSLVHAAQTFDFFFLLHRARSVIPCIVISHSHCVTKHMSGLRITVLEV
jgi:hypothetical protein